MTDCINEWKRFFNGYAPRYDEEVFTKNTAVEIEFLMEELKLPAGAGILDMGCGTGRHTVGLAGQGFRVTGVDISGGMLALAQASADEAGVEIELVESDARDFVFHRRFDAAICLCEGSLCLLGSGDDPFKRDILIMANIFDSLKPGGRFVTTVLNACRLIRAMSDEDVESGRFDPLTLVETSEMEVADSDGVKKVTVRERQYTVPEFTRMLHRVGFGIEHIWGGTAGNWRRGPIKLDEYEFMVVARKPCVENTE